MHAEGFPWPRIMPDLPPDVGFELGDAAIGWIDSRMAGSPLMGWQRLVLRTALATVPDRRAPGGRRLLFSTVVVRLARQQGKTYKARRLLAWRLLEGERVFGQPQRLINTHPDGVQAVRLLEPVARQFGYMRGGTPGFSKQTFMGQWFPGGVESEESAAWFARAMTTNALTGNQGITFTYVDELQDAKDQQVTEALGGSLSGSRVVQPQRWFTGTGEKPHSELLRKMRKRIGRPGMCWLEWSAPPGTDAADENGWRWASPDWSPARLEYLREQLVELGPREFAANYLLTDDLTSRVPWLDEGAWWASRVPGVLPGPGGVAAVEDEPGGPGGFAAYAWVDDRVHVVARRFDRLADAYGWADGVGPSSWLVGYSLRKSAEATARLAEPRSNVDTASALPEFRRMVAEDALRWDGDQLADNATVLVVKDNDTRSGLQVIPTEGIHSAGVRCAAWAACDAQRLIGADLDDWQF